MAILTHVAGRVLGTPLMIEPGKLDVILSVLGPRIGLGAQRPLPMPPAVRPRRDLAVTGDGIAVIPVIGTLVKRVGPVEAASGLMSYGEIEERFLDAVTDPAVRAVLLEVDSAGGEAAGVFDLADQVYAARELKPIWAVADEEAFSGAYAIASAAERVLLPRTGGMGSIGVVAVHVDRSARDAQEGFRYTTVFAGARKNDLNPHEPLSAEGRAALQTEVERVYELFAATVARNRGTSADAVKATESALFFGENAVIAGLADGVASFKEALAGLQEEVARGATVTRVALPALATNQQRHRQEIDMSDENKTLAAPETAPPKGETPAPKAEATERDAPNTPVPAPAETPKSATAENRPTAATASDANAGQTAEVIDLDRVRAEGYREAAAIADLCALAGMPERASDMTARRLSAEDARTELLSLKAAGGGPEIHSHVLPGAGSGSREDLDNNPVVRAAKARAAKMMEA